MKLFKKFLNYKIFATSLLLSGALFTSGDEQFSILPSYKNKISHISYGIGSDDQHALTFAFQEKPICMYTPLSYQEFQESNLKKTYFLPRTQCADSHIRYFYEDVKRSLQALGIEVQFQEIANKNYGLQMNFILGAHTKYEIQKVVDSEKKLIHFNFVAKI